jgi:O-antigen ligase
MQVTTICLVLLFLTLTLHVLPGTKMVPHVLHNLLLIWSGILVRVFCAIFRALSIFL